MHINKICSISQYKILNAKISSSNRDRLALKTDRKLRMSTFISYQKRTSGVTPSPLAYGLYTCENVDNYEWPLTILYTNKR